MKPLHIIVYIISCLFIINSVALANETLPGSNENFTYWNKSDSLVFEIKHKLLLEKGKKNPHNGLELIEELKCDSIQLTSLQKAQLHYTEGKLKGYVLKFREAIMLFEKAIDSYGKSEGDFTKDIARAYWTMSNSYYRLGEFDKGIAKLLDGLDLIEGTDYFFEKSQLLVMLGVLNIGIEEFDSAEKHYLKALEYGKLAGSKNVYIIQNNLAEIYLRKKAYAKAHEYYTQAAYNADVEQNYTALLHIYFNLADLNIEIEEYHEALKFINKGKLIKQKANSSDLESHLFLIEAKLLLNTYIEKLDVKELKNILETAERSKTLQDAVIAAEILKKYYRKTKEYKEALFYSEKQKALKDELNSMGKSMKSATIIANNKHKKQLAFMVSKKDKTITVAFISLIILFLLGSKYYVDYKKQKNKTNQIATLLDEEKNSNQSIANSLKSAYQLKLQKFKFTFSDLVYENISAQLHDDIASSIAGIKYGLSGLQSANQDPMIAYSIKNLNIVYSSVRDLSQRVSPLPEGPSDFKGIIKDYFKMSSEIPISLNLIGNDAFMSTHIKSELFRILKELVLNANKHSGASQIKIEIKLNEDHIYASVHDNGRGFYQHTLGQGLSNIRNRVYQLNGNFKLMTNIGTKIKVFIPLIESESLT